MTPPPRMHETAAIDYHVPVLLHEALDLVVTNPDGLYLDGTLGGGGHSKALIERLGPKGRLLAIDRDPEAILRAENWSLPYGARVRLIKGNFADTAAILAGLDLAGVDGMLLDLGVSSRQLDESERGFSFMRSGPLDMRMDPTRGTSAAELVNTLPEGELEKIFRRYGEEPRARRAAKAIGAARAKSPLSTTIQLAELIEKALGRSSGKHPATRVFQALRIAVNGEMEALEGILGSLPGILLPGGRIVVISYHSLEDRLVKTAFRTLAPHCTCPPLWPVCGCGTPGSMQVLTRKAIRPDLMEIETNSRARSAKLRAAARLVKENAE